MSVLLAASVLLLVLGVAFSAAYLVKTGGVDGTREQITAGVKTLTAPDYVTGVQAATYGVFTLPLLAATPVVRALPPTWRLFHKLHTWSAWQMQKAANADAVANVRLTNGKEDVRPAKFVEGDEDEKDLSGWKVKGLGDKRYDTAVHGRTTTRLGKADIIHVNEDDTEQGTWTEATIDNAFQLDRERYLFRDATVEIKNLVYDYAGPSDGEAVADGGQMQPNQRVQTQDVSLTKPGVLEDVLVPISSRSGYDGQVVSWSQYSSLKSGQSDQETVRDAKNSAWAAAKLDEIEGQDLIKWILIIGLWSCLLLFHQEIGAFIAGLGGGGGGGSVGGALGLLPLAGRWRRGE